MTNKESGDLSTIARQVKRAVTMNKRKQAIKELPDCPPLLSLNQLASKTGLPYLFLRKMIIEEAQVPYIRVGNKVCVNYDLFLDMLNRKEV